MKGLKQTTRETIAYIAAKHSEGSFHTNDIPEQYRYALSGCKNKGFLDTLSRDNKKRSTFKVTPQGPTYARRYAADEMAAVL